MFFQTPLWCKHLCTSLKAFVIKLKHTKNQQFMNTSNASLIRYIFITMFMYEGSDFIWDTLYWNILLILAEIKHKCQHWYYRMAALVVDSFSSVSIFFVFDFFFGEPLAVFFFFSIDFILKFFVVFFTHFQTTIKYYLLTYTTTIIGKMEGKETFDNTFANRIIRIWLGFKYVLSIKTFIKT